MLPKCKPFGGAALAATTALTALACGNPGGDLIALEERGAHFTRLVVTDDGRGSCNGGELKRLESSRLLEAREVERELQELATERTNFPDPTGGRQFRAKMRDATVTWMERSQQDPVLPKATALTLELRRELCPAPATP
ncbi:MAG TPA: hypothetical protein VF517_13565 [Thermoleophilaceae bacterium]|jgi:hypothetical protein